MQTNLAGAPQRPTFPTFLDHSCPMWNHQVLEPLLWPVFLGCWYFLLQFQQSSLPMKIHAQTLAYGVKVQHCNHQGQSFLSLTRDTSFCGFQPLHPTTISQLRSIRPKVQTGIWKESLKPSESCMQSRWTISVHVANKRLDLGMVIYYWTVCTKNVTVHLHVWQ